jgi:hypothetical protein
MQVKQWISESGLPIKANTVYSASLIPGHTAPVQACLVTPAAASES